MIINTRNTTFKIFIGSIIFIIFVYITSTSKFSSTYSSNEQVICHNTIVSNQVDEIEAIFNGLFNQSAEQLLVDKHTLMKTMRFMVEERDELDPELIAFVRSLIVRPPLIKGQLNLAQQDRTDFSQVGQSKYIDTLLGSKTNGFFIESGGYDGESHSNSLFFELERNWNGILIEPVPSFYQKILSKKRNVHVINACIAGKLPLVAKFRVYRGLSVRVAEMSEDHKSRMERENLNLEKRILDYVNVPCFSLNTILAALDVKRVDYFSLDVEGGEWSVISNLNLKDLDIKAFSIEFNGFQEPKNLIKNHLESKGYEYLKEDRQDIYFIKK
jgi:FkbM family methyltransferase